MKSLTEAIKKFALPFNTPNDLTPLLNAIGDAKIVLLGEASHGTSEFYKVRAELSKRLIQEKGFTLIAVEGDWPSTQRVNRFIKGYDPEVNGQKVLNAFERWPTWMWANEETSELVKWLEKHNKQLEDNRKIGFYGIDVYSLWESLDEVIGYLRKMNPEGTDMAFAKRAISCFEPFNRHPETYAFSSIHISDACVEEVTKLLASIRNNEEQYEDGQEADLNLKINALVAQNAEEYYRAMVRSDPDFEAYGNYVPSKIGSRYDAFIYIDKTNALSPLPSFTL